MAKKSSDKNISAESILADHSLEVRTLAENLRRIIRETKLTLIRSSAKPVLRKDHDQ